MKITKQRLREIIKEELASEGILDFFKKKKEPYKAPEKLAAMRARSARDQKPPSKSPDPGPDLYNMVDDIRDGLGKVYKAYSEWPSQKAREAAKQFRTQIIGTGASSRPENWDRLVRDVNTAEDRPGVRDPGRQSYTSFVAFLKGIK